MTRKTTFHARIESLERREAPSNVSFSRVFVPLRGSGTGQTSGLVTLPAPGFFATAQNVRGTIEGRSTFTAQGGVNVTLNRDAIGDLNLTLADGNQLTLRVKGRAHPTGNPARPAIASGTFRVIGGTGPLENARGQGLINARIDSATGSFTFRFNGKISE